MVNCLLKCDIWYTQCTNCNSTAQNAITNWTWLKERNRTLLTVLQKPLSYSFPITTLTCFSKVATLLLVSEINFVCYKAWYKYYLYILLFDWCLSLWGYSMLCIGVVCSFSLLKCISLCALIILSINEHLDYFCFGPVIKKYCLNIFLHVFVIHMYVFLLGIYQVIELLGHSIWPFCSLPKNWPKQWYLIVFWMKKYWEVLAFRKLEPKSYCKNNLSFFPCASL